MPYDNITQIPKHLHSYSEVIQRMWLATFNSTWKKLTKEGVAGKNREARAFKAANSVIKKRVEKHSADKYGHKTHFMVNMDIFLKNLEG